MADNYNVEATEILAKEALRLPIAQAVPIYEKILAAFPTAAKYWQQYVEAQISGNNDDEAVRKIFSRCLLNCLHIPLWLCYIRFIKRVNANKGFQGQEETRKAYDFMINYIGTDIKSGPVWLEYIGFLKFLQFQTTSPEVKHQLMIDIRKTYQKAIVIPTHEINQIWRDYESFENSTNRSSAKGLLSEYQQRYNSARAVYGERRKHTEEIDWNMLALPPSAYSSKRENQWMVWKKALAFEKRNPQRIDSNSANERIACAYEQSLMYLYHYPDIWYDYATWHTTNGSTDSGIKVFHRALQALPKSTMLKYAYAELEESNGSIPAAKKVYESLLRDDHDKNSNNNTIQFIRFLRRTEGAEAARKYFLDARSLPSCTYHVYVAYAIMTFCIDKDAEYAKNVFQSGLKHFMHEPKYIIEYIDFLSRLNDEQNVRSLFEWALSSLPPEKSINIWKRYIEFEQTFGDLTSMLKVEQRMKDSLSRIDDNNNSLQNVVSRYSFKDLSPCSSDDLNHLIRHELISKNYPDISKMMSYPSQNITHAQVQHVTRTLTPKLAAFAANMPLVPGNFSSPAHQIRKRKHQDGRDYNDDDCRIQSQPLEDAFRLRQRQKTHCIPPNSGSGRNGFSGEISTRTI